MAQDSRSARSTGDDDQNPTNQPVYNYGAGYYYPYGPYDYYSMPPQAPPRPSTVQQVSNFVSSSIIACINMCMYSLYHILSPLINVTIIVSLSVLLSLALYMPTGHKILACSEFTHFDQCYTANCSDENQL